MTQCAWYLWGIGWFQPSLGTPLVLNLIFTCVEQCETYEFFFPLGIYALICFLISDSCTNLCLLVCVCMCVFFFFWWRLVSVKVISFAYPQRYLLTLRQSLFVQFLLPWKVHANDSLFSALLFIGEMVYLDSFFENRFIWIVDYWDLKWN